MRKIIEKYRFQDADGKPIEVLKPGDPEPRIEEVLEHSPIKRDDWQLARIEAFLLIKRHYPDAAPEQFVSVFCNECDVLVGVGSSDECVS